jgi:hypothetical protein
MLCSTLVASLRRNGDFRNLNYMHQKESGYIIFLKSSSETLLSTLPRVIRPEEGESQQFINADARKHYKRMKTGSGVIASMATKFISAMGRCK